MKDLKAELAPALRRVNEKQQYEREAKAVKQQRKRELEDGEKNVVKASKKIDDLEDRMKECDNMYAAERKGAGSKREEEKRIQQSITRIKKQMEEEPEAFDPRALNEQIQQKVDRVREMEDKNHEINEQAHTLRAQGLRKKADAEELQKRLGSLETQSGQQENKLEKASHDTYEAWQWIKENQDKFEQHVYGPPMVECSLKNPRQADAVGCLWHETNFVHIT